MITAQYEEYLDDGKSFPVKIKVSLDAALLTLASFTIKMQTLSQKDTKPKHVSSLETICCHIQNFLVLDGVYSVFTS
jgi:hypothetical protein